MKDIKVLILEDQLPEASYLRDKLISMGYLVPAVATSLSEGLEYFSMYQPDISLVDIYLDGKPDGIVYGMKMSEEGQPKKPFLFLTGSQDISTFSLAKSTMPYHYLIKPFNESEIQYAIELALERYRTEVSAVSSGYMRQPTCNSVFVKRGNTLVSILYDEIKYIEVDGKYSKLICYNQKFIVQQSLGELHNSLPTDQFLRVHRRYVINLKEITRIDTQTHEIFFKDGNTLFFSRRYLEEFLNIFKFIK
jgi:DNA-binding LytR/AlgR family response regulator